MDNAFVVSANRSYRSDVNYTFGRSVARDWMSRNRKPGNIGRVYQLSKNSWRFVVFSSAYSRPYSGRATTFDQALQKCIAAYRNRY